MKITKTSKIAILMLLIVFFMIPLLFYKDLQDSNIVANVVCKVTLESVKNVKYKTHRIPMKLVFHNPNDKQIKLLKPMLEERFIGNLNVLLYDKNNKYLCSSQSLPLAPNQLKKITFVYIEILPKKNYEIVFDLRRLITTSLEPGVYSMRFEYENKHGADCVKNFVSVNKPTITIDPPDNLMGPGYLSKKKVLDIAKKKANGMAYDRSKPIKISLDEGIYTVTFPFEPQGRFKTEMWVKYRIDAKSGKVMSVMAP